MAELRGKLVRILDGRQWELWTEEGYAGLERMMREFEGREVRVVIEENKEWRMENRGGEKEESQVGKSQRSRRSRKKGAG